MKQQFCQARRNNLGPNLVYFLVVFFSKTIQVKVTKDCEKTDEVEYNWNITLHKEDGSIEIITSVNHSKTDSALKIPARTLTYGTYGIHLTLCMKDVYPPVCTTITGFIKVNPSIMVAQFEGGSGRAGGKDRILQISAMPSHDPDTSLTFDDDIKVAWCCKRQSEIFPDNLEDIPDLDYPEEVCKSCTLLFNWLFMAKILISIL